MPIAIALYYAYELGVCTKVRTGGTFEMQEGSHRSKLRWLRLVRRILLPSSVTGNWRSKNWRGDLWPPVAMVDGRRTIDTILFLEETLSLCDYFFRIGKNINVRVGRRKNLLREKPTQTSSLAPKAKSLLFFPSTPSDPTPSNPHHGGHLAKQEYNIDLE